MKGFKFVIVLIIALAVIAAAAVYAVLAGNTVWAYDAAFLAVLLLIVYACRGFLNLTSFLFALLGLAAIMHMAGAFGAFKTVLLGMEYDTYVHFMTGAIGVLIVYNFLALKQLGTMERVAIALLLLLGIDLVHELLEFAGYNLFGQGEGLFLLGPGDIGRTNAYENLMTDFSNEFLGALLGLVAGLVYEYLSGKRRSK